MAAALTAPVTLDPSPMTRFSNRGAVFTTPGTGFEISGLPSPEFGEINAGYPALFVPFSSPRLFTRARQQRHGRVVLRARQSTTVAGRLSPASARSSRT